MVTSSHTHTHIKHNSHPKVDNGFGRKGERHWSLQVIHIHIHIKHNSLAEVVSELGGKGRAMGHFLSYMHTQNTTYNLKLDNGLGEKKRGIGHF